jgi:hypothetical protein
MTSTRSALDVDWLGVCRRAVKGLERVLDVVPRAPVIAARTEDTLRLLEGIPAVG